MAVETHLRTRPQSSRHDGLTNVIAVTSKLPIVHKKDGWVTAPGGLAPIVRRALDYRGGIWVAWDGNAESPPRELASLGFQVETFSMGSRQADGFYGGYSNRTLWPLLHNSVVPPTFDPTWWASYRDANRAYTQATAHAAARARDAVIWVHDYQLMLVPRYLRELSVMNPISFFLHTPFPSPDMFMRLPQRAELLAGLGHASRIGFQTERDRRHFLQTWALFESDVAPPQTVVAPASIDVEALKVRALHTRVAAGARTLRRGLRDRILLVSAERLDYTKGILERLHALEILLVRRPEFRRRLAYVQLATPSRENVLEYRQLRAKVEREIGRLNGRFTVSGHDVPFRYLHRSVSDRQLLSYFMAADVALVTPLQDGMNLVAKEFVVAQAAADGRGMLVLSEFAGAAAELTDAVFCNPFDADGTSRAIEEAIEMSDDHRKKRVHAMADVVAAGDLDRWSGVLLDEI